jgi:hypothetical protein
MKLILTQTNAPAAAVDAREVIAAWQSEHAGYYARPHGIRHILVGLEFAYCGYSETTIPTSGTGYTQRGASRWLTCGGNDHRIWTDGQTVIAAYCGRRHGMRAEFRDFLENYWNRDGSYTNVEQFYVTQEPDWMPWETADSRQPLPEPVWGWHNGYGLV